MIRRWWQDPSPRSGGGSSHGAGDDRDSLAGWLAQPGIDLTDVDAVVVGGGGNEVATTVAGGARTTALHATGGDSMAARRGVRRPIRRRVTWRVADPAAPPDDLVGAFGLVVDASRIDASAPADRAAVMRGIGSLVCTGGMLVSVVLMATSDEARRAIEGPPWPLAPADLTGWRAAGLQRLELAHPPAPADAPPIHLVRTTWRRPD